MSSMSSSTLWKSLKYDSMSARHMGHRVSCFKHTWQTHECRHGNSARDWRRVWQMMHSGKLDPRSFSDEEFDISSEASLTSLESSMLEVSFTSVESFLKFSNANLVDILVSVSHAAVWQLVFGIVEDSLEETSVVRFLVSVWLSVVVRFRVSVWLSVVVELVAFKLWSAELSWFVAK